MSAMTVIEAVRSTLDEAMGADERAFIIGEDVEAGGVFRATEGLHAKYGERVIDSPLAESSIIGISIGAAHYGSAQSRRSSSPTSFTPVLTSFAARPPAGATALPATRSCRW